MKPMAFITKTGEMVGASVLDGYATKGESQQLPADPYQGSYGGRGRGLMQPPYSLDALAQLPELNTYHMRCCVTKARDTAGLGFEMVPVEGTGEDASEEQKKVALGFFRNLSEPITETLNKAQFDCEAVGMFYVEVEVVNGVPVDMHHIPAHTMRVHKSGKRFAQVRGSKIAWFNEASAEGTISVKDGQPTDDPNQIANEVIVGATYSPKSDYYGVPEVIPAIGAIRGHLAQRDYNVAFFRNHGIPAYAVYVYGDYDLGDYVNDEGEVVPDGDPTGDYATNRAIKRYFAQASKNPHSTLILTIPSASPEGQVKVEIKPLSIEVKEASFTIYRKDNRDEVLTAHGVDPYRAGIAEVGSLSGTTAKQATEIYKMSIINPRQAKMEHLINKHIVTRLGCTDWRFKLVEIDTSDELHDVDMLQKMWLMGGVTANEIIKVLGARFGLKEVDHPLMNAHWIAGIPIDVSEEYNPQMLNAVKSMMDELWVTIKAEGDRARADAAALEDALERAKDTGALLGDQVGGI